MDNIIEIFKENNYDYIKTEIINKHIYYFYICNNHKEDGLKKIRKDSFLKGSRCKKCITERNKEIKLEKSKKDFNIFVSSTNEYKIIGSYVNANTNIDMLHLNCNKKFSPTPGHFKDGTRCPYCAGRNKNTDDFKKQVFELVGDEYTVIGNYTKANEKLTMYHNKCNYEYEVTPTKFLQNRRCPNCIDCNNSYLSLEIEKVLMLYNINYKREYTFEDCRHKNVLPFDFAIFNNGELYCLIEADGDQHLKPSSRFGGEEGFRLTKLRDSIKNNYCHDNNIKLLRISPKEIKNIKNILVKNIEFIDFKNINTKKIIKANTIKRKLSTDDIYNIRYEYSTIKTNSRDMANKYNVSKTTILNILNYETYLEILPERKDTIAENLSQSKNGIKKFSEDKCVEILKLYKTNKYSMRAIGRMYGVSHHFISRIVEYSKKQ